MSNRSRKRAAAGMMGPVRWGSRLGWVVALLAGSSHAYVNPMTLKRHAPGTAFQSNVVSRSRYHRQLYSSLKVEFNDRLTFDEDGPRIVFRSKKAHVQPIKEQPGHRTLLEYMALPVEEYSVLDAATIFKKNSNEFTYVVQPVSFLGNRLEAVIDAIVDVSPYPEGKSVIRVVGCTLEGGQFASMSGRSARSRRQDLKIERDSAVLSVDCDLEIKAIVPQERKQWALQRLISRGRRENAGESQEDIDMSDDQSRLSVDCNLEISVLIPREGRWIPKRVVGKAGSMVIYQLLSVLIPRFVEQVATDYQIWGAGDDSRAPVVPQSKASMASSAISNFEANVEAEEKQERQNKDENDRQDRKRNGDKARQWRRRLNARRRKNRGGDDDNQSDRSLPGIRSFHRRLIRL